MKKTIQITLSGIVFNIEEDAFPKLEQYLTSIKKYFSNYEGSAEILEDIEGRIAEKFYQKAQNNEAINLDDVNQVTAAMGTVSDFEAFNEEEFTKPVEDNTQKTTTEQSQQTTEAPKTRFFRDAKNKALGGVLAGLAYQYNFDVVWARILFIMLSLGLIDQGLGGGFMIAYLICWIVFPERKDLTERTNIKKFFRIRDNKVLGGVATGLSQYLNIDLVIVRIILVVLAFAGIGIIAYLIFWIVAPYADTLTQKMELKGQAITIENIESNIKTSGIAAAKPESSLATLLLFPFRIIGIILGALGQLLRPVSVVIRFLAGIIILLLGISFTLATLLSTGAFFGLLNEFPIHGTQFIEFFSKELGVSGGIFMFLVLFIPSISLAILGVSLISNTKYGNRNFWLTALALWFAGVLGASVLASKYSLNYKRTASFTEETILTAPKNTLYLDIIENSDNGVEQEFYGEIVNIKASNDNQIRLKTNYSATGKDTETALANAHKIAFNMIQKDSVLQFPEELTISGKILPRRQNVEATLYIPTGKKFKMTKKFAEKLLGNSWEILDNLSVDADNIEKYTLTVNANDEIICEDCPKLTENEKDALRFRFGENEDFENKGQFTKTPKLEAFTNIEARDNVYVEVKYGNEQKVELFAENEQNLQELKVNVSGNTLKIGFNDPFKRHYDKINLVITLPEIKIIELSGGAKGKVYGFENTNQLTVDLSGASSLALAVNADMIQISASGASTLLCKGKANQMELDLSGGSEFNGKEFAVNQADVEASGGSTADLGQIKNLKSKASGGSEISKR